MGAHYYVPHFSPNLTAKYTIIPPTGIKFVGYGFFQNVESLLKEVKHKHGTQKKSGTKIIITQSTGHKRTFNI